MAAFTPRAPGEIEWKKWAKDFPNAVENEVRVIGPESKKYNCFAWSLGFNDRWIDGSTREKMKTLYEHYYYETSTVDKADVDMYDYPGSKSVMHAHRNVNRATSECSSKLGNSSLIEHKRHALESTASATITKPQYGTIYGWFQKSSNHPDDPSKLPEADHPELEKHEQPIKNSKTGNDVPVGHLNSSVDPPTASQSHSSNTHAAPHAAAPHPNVPHPAAPHPAAPHPAAPHPAAPHPAAPHAAAPHIAAPHIAAPHTTAPHVTPHTTAPHGAPHNIRRFAVKAASPAMAPYEPIPSAHPAAVATAQNTHAQLSQTFAPAVSNFEELYAAWKATWFSGDNEHSSNSIDRAKGPEFEALVALGAKIIPLVVHKLTNPDDFMAVQLYNALEKDEHAKVDPDSIGDSHVLQRHANLVVDMNHARAQEFDGHVGEWEEHREQNAQHSSSSADHVSGEGYENLVQLGEGVIGHVMARYARDPDGWWHELLHHIVHGERAGPGTFFKERLFDDWKEWFEQKPHAEAPKGL